MRLFTTFTVKSSVVHEAFLFAQVCPGSVTTGIKYIVHNIHWIVRHDVYKLGCRLKRRRHNCRHIIGHCFIWWEAFAIVWNWYFWMRVNSIMVNNMELLLESLINEDDSNQAGKTFLRETCDVPDQSAKVKGDDQHYQASSPYPNPCSKW